MAAAAAASSEALRWVALYDERKWWERDGATSMCSWLSARYGLAWGTAREWVRVARALRELPRIAEAFARGRLSWDQLRPLTKFAAAETDEAWAGRAQGLWPSTLWREARRHERATVRESNDVRRRRHLELWEDPEVPVMYLEGMLPSEEGAAVRAALEKRAQEVVLADSPYCLVHEGGWSMRGHPAEELRFHDPRGRPLGRGPALARAVARIGPFP